MPRSLARTLLAALALLTIAPAARAAWPPDAIVGGVALENLPTIAYYPAACTDGAGGAIVAWSDYRNGTSQLYAQRVNAAGVPQWNAAGNLVCAVAGDKYNPVIVADGAGGAVIAWEDLRTGGYDVYAQRLSPTGSLLWTTTGVPVCARPLEQWWLHLIADGAGSFFVSWEHGSGEPYDAYAQKLNLSGVAQWAANGLMVCPGIYPGTQPRIAPDGLGGVWMVTTRASDQLAYAQRVSSPGATVWPAPGKAIGAGGYGQSGVDVINDGYGRAIVTWVDNRGPVGFQGYAQCVNADGTMRWLASGVPLSDRAGSQTGERLCTDGSGGAIIVFQDRATDGNGDIFAQRITAAGVQAWGSSGASICQQPGYQYPEVILPDDAGGVLMTWYDNRSGNADLYAQRIGPTAQFYWANWQGLPVSQSAGDQYGCVAVPTPGGWIAAWRDLGGGGGGDVYAQRIDRQGVLGAPAPSIAAIRDVPNDQGGQVKLMWNASYQEAEPYLQVYGYGIWRSVPPNVAMTALANGARVLRGDEPAPLADDGRAAAEGTKLLRATPYGAQTYWWEYVTQQSAHRLTNYSLVVDTPGDSVSGSNPRTAFMVEALGANNQRWFSAPDSGYSVDNIAPAPPAPFTGQYAGGTTRLHWNPNAEPDLAGYRLYRGTSTSFAPGAGNLVASPPDTGWADAAGAAYVYKLTAVDAHGNESPVTTLVPTGTVDAPGAHAAIDFLAPLSPNPLRGTGKLRFGLARAGRVSVAVYDTQGRRVRTLLAGDRPAGEHALRLDARDDAGRALAPGLYLVRMNAAGFRATERVVVTP